MTNLAFDEIGLHTNVQDSAIKYSQFWDEFDINDASFGLESTVNFCCIFFVRIGGTNNIFAGKLNSQISADAGQTCHFCTRLHIMFNSHDHDVNYSQATFSA